jgi:chaperonin GroEL
VLNVLAIKAPGFGEKRKEMLRDISILTGGTVIADELGMKLENVTLAELGRAKSVIASKDTTTVIGGAGEKSDIEARVSELKTLHTNTESKYDKEQLVKRIAKLAG